MAEQKQIGMTYGQVLSTIGLLLIMGASWVSLVEKISANAIKIEALEKGRIDNAANIEKVYRENREDHKLILDKLDYYFEKQKK